MKKHKTSYVGYTLENWKLKKLGLCIIHTLIWTKKVGDKCRKVRITMEEI